MNSEWSRGTRWSMRQNRNTPKSPHTKIRLYRVIEAKFTHGLWKSPKPSKCFPGELKSFPEINFVLCLFITIARTPNTKTNNDVREAAGWGQINTFLCVLEQEWNEDVTFIFSQHIFTSTGENVRRFAKRLRPWHTRSDERSQRESSPPKQSNSDTKAPFYIFYYTFFTFSHIHIWINP